jgi:hypothetical protein
LVSTPNAAIDNTASTPRAQRSRRSAASRAEMVTLEVVPLTAASVAPLA